MERNRESRYTKRLRGGAGPGEPASARDARGVKGPGAVHVATVRGRRAFLPGARSPWACKGDADVAARAVSRGHSSRAEAGQGGQPGEGRRLWRGEGPNGRERDTTVRLGGARRQMSTHVELPLAERGEAPNAQRSGEALTAAQGTGRSGTDPLMERVVERGTVTAAVKRVRQNKGSPGMEGLTVEERLPYLVDHWATSRAQRLEGTYPPTPVRAGAIPKSGGGGRTRGIPSALDRGIPQSILRGLPPMGDPTFSAHSHGFRPRRCAHHAVHEAQRYIPEGKRGGVDVDLEHSTASTTMGGSEGWRNALRTRGCSGSSVATLKAASWPTGSSWSGTKGPRRGAPARHSWRTCSSMTWTRSGSSAGSASSATLRT